MALGQFDPGAVIIVVGIDGPFGAALFNLGLHDQTVAQLISLVQAQTQMVAALIAKMG